MDIAIVAKDASNTQKRRRINTAYEKEEMNWIYTYKECYEEAIAHYEEMWLDYYMSR